RRRLCRADHEGDRRGTGASSVPAGDGPYGDLLRGQDRPRDGRRHGQGAPPPVGLIGQQLSRAVPVQRARTGAASTAAMSATASGLTANRRQGPSGSQLYRSWAVHGELVRAALDVQIAPLTKAEWDLVPFDRTGRTPDVGLMNRMKEILMQPN